MKSTRNRNLKPAQWLKIALETESPDLGVLLKYSQDSFDYWNTANLGRLRDDKLEFWAQITFLIKSKKAAVKQP